MTPARSPLQELADVIYGTMAAATDGVLNEAAARAFSTDIARAVAAHLSRPDTVERMRAALCRADCLAAHMENASCSAACIANGNFRDNQTTQLRAAVAAVVGEDV